MADEWVGGSIKDPEVDRVLRDFVDVCEAAFPNRVRAYYLAGSWADGTAVRTPGDALNSSDVDVTIVFEATLADAEASTFRRLRAAYEGLSGLGADQLDAVAVGEDALLRDGRLTLTTASRLLRGHDIRAEVPPPSTVAYLPHAVRISTDVMAAIRDGGAPDILNGTAPLAYPDPGGEFYGYDFRDEAYGGIPGTRVLIDGLTWGAAAVVAIRRGVLAGTKREAIRLHASQIGDEWSTLLDELYDRCKLRWRYQIPADKEDRSCLRHLCARVLPLEARLVGLYREHRSTDRAGLH